MLYGLFLSTIAIATLGSRETFLCFTLPCAVFTRIIPSTRSIHTGVICGELSFIKVATNAKFLSSISLATSGDIVPIIATWHALQTCHPLQFLTRVFWCLVFLGSAVLETVCLLGRVFQLQPLPTLQNHLAPQVLTWLLHNQIQPWHELPFPEILPGVQDFPMQLQYQTGESSKAVHCFQSFFLIQ